MLTSQINSLYGAALGRCRGPERGIAFVTDDRELPRLLAYLGFQTDFPIIALPRSPPAFVTGLTGSFLPTGPLRPPLAPPTFLTSLVTFCEEAMPLSRTQL